MFILAFDTEASGATTPTRGNPHCPKNKLACISYKTNEGESDVLPIEYGGKPYGDNIRKFGGLLERADLVVGFAIKYDIHWGRRYGLSFRGKRIWDTQLAHFIITHQRNPDPSLDETGRYCLDRGKIDKVKTDYWDKEIDTLDIPWDVLYEYSLDDADLTYGIYEWQERNLEKHSELRNLIFMHCQDLLVTQEMEYNGLKYNFKLSREKAREVKLEIEELNKFLDEAAGEFDNGFKIDWNSKENISAYLYGGIINRKEKTPYEFHYKDGRIATKTRWTVVSRSLPRQITPLTRSGLKKVGFYRTDEKTLRMLKAKGKVKQVINTILKRNELSKLVGTYYEGIPNISKEYGWEDGIIHGQLNHVRAGTGRLASSKPNQQNMDERVLECLETRF